MNKTSLDRTAPALPCLGLIEVPFLSVAAVLAEAVAKHSGARLLGLEPSGNEWILIRCGADSPDALTAAVEHARGLAGRLHSDIRYSVLARPHQEIAQLNDSPLSRNPLYGGREELRPTDYQPNLKDTMNTPNSAEALGILETQGLTASLEAADAMLKAANVKLVGKEKIGAAYVTIIVRGDVAAVKAAVDAGAVAGEPFGKIIAAHTIARPHEDLAALLPG
jgi:microcompartment protein CcmL/EutN